MDNVDHSPITIAFCDEIDAFHYKTYSVFFRGGHCYARNHIEARRINRCLNCHELIYSTRSCSRKPRCVHCTSTEHVSAEHPKHECKESEKKCPRNNLKYPDCNVNHAVNYPGCLVWMKRRGFLKDAGPTRQKQPPGRRNKHAVKVAGLARSVKESQMQRKTKT